ncbi:MAG: YXWGXW repeat-containing protein [Sinimarinibacterium sp.]|jgi:hypothetical protein
MKLRTVGILAGLLAVGAFAAPLTSFAEPTELKIIVDTAPPAAKKSAPPTASKVGYVWSSGYWNWNGSAYVWTEGSWVAVVEPAKKWVEPTWTQQGTKWYFTAGHWE